MHSGNSKRKMGRFLSTSWIRVTRVATWTLLQIAPLYFLPLTPTIHNASFILLAMTKGNCSKGQLWNLFWWPGLLSDNRLLIIKFRFILHHWPRATYVLEAPYFVQIKGSFLIRVDCELFLVFSKIVETNSQNDEHSAPKLRVTNTAGVRHTEKPLVIKLHMMPSTELHPGLDCLELTTMHHSVDN